MVRSRVRWPKHLLVAALGLALLGCQGREASAPGAAAGDDWPVHGGTPSEQRFSALEEINDGNVKQLGLAWTATFDTNRGQEATPIMVDGVLYVSTAWSKVYAYDAETGRQLWFFDPQVPGGKGVHACCDVVNRGVAVAKGRVFVGTIDGRLIGLDAKSGKPLWSAQTFDPAKPYTITGAPRIVKDKVIIGNGGADLGVRGFVTAYDQATGKLAWRFYTVPGDPAKGPDGAASDEALARVAGPTWAGEWWKNGGGGGTVWDSIVYDPELDQVYIGVGNSSVWDRHRRSAGKGDNLFVASIVALDPDTGRYRWHYQQTPGDEWDYTSTQQIMLADLTLDGQPRKVILHAPKNGFFYVIDRTSGKLVSAKNFVPVNWAKGIDPKTGRPIEVRNVRYEEAPFDIYPGPLGAHSWQPMSYSAKTGLVYIPANLTHVTHRRDPNFRYREGRWNTAVISGMPIEKPSAITGVRPEGAPEGYEGELIAWDPVAQKARWRVHYPFAWNGGTLATAGNLVFQGSAAGMFQAFRATDGTKLWEASAGTAVMAGPISYRLKGVQYIAVLAGTGGGAALAGRSGMETRTMPSGRLLVYKLGGTAPLPVDDGSPLATPQPSKERFAPAQMAEGARHYFANCMICHGGSVLPDLRRSAAIGSAETWKSIVIDGVLEERGMASFRDYLTPAEAESIRAYVNGEAYLLLQGKDKPVMAPVRGQPVSTGQ